MHKMPMHVLCLLASTLGPGDTWNPAVHVPSLRDKRTQGTQPRQPKWGVWHPVSSMQPVPLPQAPEPTG